MNKSSYDTKDGIQKMIISLHGFNELLKLRREASKKEELNEFIILGRWCLDSRGDLGKVSVESARKERKEMLPNIPDVLTREEFSNLICERNIYEERKISFSVTVGSHVVIPPADLHCGKCQLKWDVANCHDVVVAKDPADVDISDFIGKQLWELQRELAKRTDALYNMPDGIMIRNDRFIDTEPDYYRANTSRNKNGWLSKEDGLDIWYVIQPGDETTFDVWTYYHTACWLDNLNRDSEDQVRKIFGQAGFNIIEMLRINNEYCGCVKCAPWYEVKTSTGVFVIGCRKRVINIDWGKTNLDFLFLFKDEDVTKDETHIHAWSVEAAADYLRRIRIAIRYLMEKDPLLFE